MIKGKYSHIYVIIMCSVIGAAAGNGTFLLGAENHLISFVVGLMGASMSYCLWTFVSSMWEKSLSINDIDYVTNQESIKEITKLIDDLQKLYETKVYEGYYREDLLVIINNLRTAKLTFLKKPEFILNNAYKVISWAQNTLNIVQKLSVIDLTQDFNAELAESLKSFLADMRTATLQLNNNIYSAEIFDAVIDMKVATTMLEAEHNEYVQNKTTEGGKKFEFKENISN